MYYIGLDPAHRPKNSAHSTWTPTQAAWVRLAWRQRRWLAHVPMLVVLGLAGLYLWLRAPAAAEPAPGATELGILTTAVVAALVMWATDRIYRCPVCELRPRKLYSERRGRVVDPKSCETCGVPLA
jgi:hypothetical protein